MSIVRRIAEKRLHLSEITTPPALWIVSDKHAMSSCIWVDEQERSTKEDDRVRSR